MSPGAVRERYAASLLADLGAASPARHRAGPVVVEAVPGRTRGEHWGVTAARCGLTRLTGFEQPLHCPVPLAACARGALDALRALPGGGALPEDLDGAALLTERAALRGLTRRGDVAPGGSCRLLRVADGALAVNLARDEDWAQVAAWLASTGPAPARPPDVGDWPRLAAGLATRESAPLVATGRLLGLAVAHASGEGKTPAHWFQPMVAKGPPRSLPEANAWDEGRVPAHGLQPVAGAGLGCGRFGQASASLSSERRSFRRSPAARPPLVVDLSTLWAGPLAGHLLQLLGAQVVKVESWQRPDGARSGDAAFFDLLNHGKSCLAIDWQDAADRERLRRLLEAADIVIESSRPRALRQIGIDAEALARSRPQRTWVALSAYGRGEEAAQWTGFGDDAAVAAGLAEGMRRAHGRTCFVGDAIADPLAGLHAALAAWAGWCAGGAGLLSVSLSGVVRYAVTATATPTDAAGLRRRVAEAEAACAAAGQGHAPPQARRPPGVAGALGADNARWGDWAERAAGTVRGNQPERVGAMPARGASAC